MHLLELPEPKEEQQEQKTQNQKQDTQSVLDAGWDLVEKAVPVAHWPAIWTETVVSTNRNPKLQPPLVYWGPRKPREAHF